MSLPEVPFRVLRGQPGNQAYYTYRVPLTEGMVVLDAMHYIQAHYAGDLAVRWNCKAGKCGSCSAEVNGRPALLCSARVDALLEYGEIDVSPMKAFPLIKDLVADVSQNYETAKQIPAFTPDENDPGPWTMYPEDVERLHEFHKCIECFLCQDVCHIIREHKAPFAGPRFLVKLASLQMHPKDTLDRTKWMREQAHIGRCNITKCCTEVCPEDIHITDNAIIPLKERVADTSYDPVMWLVNKVTGRK